MACLKVSALALVLAVGCVNASIELFNFNVATSTRSLANFWSEQSDTTAVRIVGQSTATLAILETTSLRRAVFFGLLNPVDETGFATMRWMGTLEDLSDYSAFEIDCRGQGGSTQFKITLRHNGYNTIYDTYFEASFQASTEDFSTVSVPFSAFKEYYQGQLTTEQTTLDLSAITAFGIKFYVGADDEIQTGPASLEVNTVTAV